jgi:hypothetical protein
MSQQWDPQVTIDVMVHTILSRRPPSRINVGMDSKYGLLLYSMFPAWARNLFNQILLPDQTPSVLKGVPPPPSPSAVALFASRNNVKKDE